MLLSVYLVVNINGPHARHPAKGECPESKYSRLKTKVKFRSGRPLAGLNCRAGRMSTVSFCKNSHMAISKDFVLHKLSGCLSFNIYYHVS